MIPERHLPDFGKPCWTPDPFFSCGENPDSTRIQIPELSGLFSIIRGGQEIQQFRVHLPCHGPGRKTLVLKTTYKAVLRESGSWRGSFQWKTRGIKG